MTNNKKDKKGGAVPACVKLEFSVEDRGTAVHFRIVSRASGDGKELVCEESSKTDSMGGKLWERKDIGCLVEYLQLNGYVEEYNRVSKVLEGH